MPDNPRPPGKQLLKRWQREYVCIQCVAIMRFTRYLLAPVTAAMNKNQRHFTYLSWWMSSRNTWSLISKLSASTNCKHGVNTHKHLTQLADFCFWLTSLFFRWLLQDSLGPKNLQRRTFRDCCGKTFSRQDALSSSQQFQSTEDGYIDMSGWRTFATRSSPT